MFSSAQLQGYRPLLRARSARHHHSRQKSNTWSTTSRVCYFLLLAVCIFVLLGQLSTLSWHVRRANDAVQRMGRFYAGRSEILDPSPRCCANEDCLTTDKGRHAVITSLRSNRYLPLVEELACSLKRTNPDLPLIVYAVPGELSSYVEARVRNITELRYWRDIYFPSQRQDGRFSLNWVKLRSWELEEFDAVLVVDSDITVLGDLSHLFKLPTAFAAVPDQDTIAPAWWFGSLGRIQGGMLFLRPCRAVAQHMLAVLARNRLLQFEYEYAEQDFLDWYFKFDRWLLPLEYNSVVPISVGNKTQGGMVARAIHFTKHKPYTKNPAVPQHWYLTCTPMEAVEVETDEELVFRGSRRFGGKLGTPQPNQARTEHQEDVSKGAQQQEGPQKAHTKGPQHSQGAQKARQGQHWQGHHVQQQAQQEGPSEASMVEVEPQGALEGGPQGVPATKPAGVGKLVANATVVVSRASRNAGNRTADTFAAALGKVAAGANQTGSQSSSNSAVTEDASGAATGQLSLEFTLPSGVASATQQANDTTAQPVVAAGNATQANATGPTVANVGPTAASSDSGAHAQVKLAQAGPQASAARPGAVPAGTADQRRQS